jgi:LysR family hydrogen peroxide-inducible transcriptional activator
MNLRDLRYLVAVADHGHFGRAAEACNVSQPTLSTQLKKLEDYLGATLFERTNKTVQITPIGAAILARARNALAEVDAILDLARGRAGPLAGPLRLGVIPTLGPYLLPWLVPRLTRAFPALELVIHEDVTAALLDRLRTHRIDAALLALPADGDEEIESVPLFDEPFWFACPTGHPLAAAESVSERDLGGDDLLVLAEGHCLRDQALAVCGRGGPRSSVADFRATSLETIRQMVAAGMGSTLFPALAVDRARSTDIVLKPLAEPAARRIALVWRPSYPRAEDFARLAETVRAALPPQVTPVVD